MIWKLPLLPYWISTPSIGSRKHDSNILSVLLATDVTDCPFLEILLPLACHGLETSARKSLGDISDYIVFSVYCSSMEL